MDGSFRCRPFMGRIRRRHLRGWFFYLIMIFRCSACTFRGSLASQLIGRLLLDRPI
ncbi:hypothetical protein PF008_g7355 [Phytophthora fragariae]|uniref:Uncharacterized protein n=1 Tax=Phytophthora fragariae TaxID=53985 RepID=A0A6G0S2P3_9STRA|nr:hypothetical protein PF008_g7355 [Phytophthora fragariae]